MASEPLNITKIDQSPLETKEMDSGLFRSSSATTTHGSSSLPSAGPCIDDNSLPPPTPSMQDNDADQETQLLHHRQQEHEQPLEPALLSVTTIDSPQPDESHASIDGHHHHGNKCPEQSEEGPEQLQDVDEGEDQEQQVTLADEPLAPGLLLESQEPTSAAVAEEEEQSYQGNTEEDVSSTVRTPEEEEGVVDGTLEHDQQRETGSDPGQQQQELPDQGSTGFNSDGEDDSQEHELTTTPCELERPGDPTAGDDKQSAPEDDNAVPVAAATNDNEVQQQDDDANHEQGIIAPTPSSSQVPDNNNTTITQVDSDYTINHHDDDHVEEPHLSSSGDDHDSLPRVQIDEPDPMPARVLEQHGDASSHHSQQLLQHEDNTRDDGSEHTVLDTRRVWEADRHAAECRRCSRRFNFLVRRHHCRRCGLVVCDRCSGHRIRLPPDEIIQDPAIDPAHYPLIAIHPQRVCDVCVRLPVKEVPVSSAVKRRATAPVSMKRSGSSQSLMSECPVCGHDLLGLPKNDQEKHLQLCLNTGSPPARPPRYLVYELSPTSPQINYECPICFEEFKAGEKIARMICLCSYHRQCLSDWLERGKGCPVHYDSAL